MTLTVRLSPNIGTTNQRALVSRWSYLLTRWHAAQHSAATWMGAVSISWGFVRSTTADCRVSIQSVKLSEDLKIY